MLVLLNSVKWNKERLGLGMIVTTIVVIGLILVLFFKYQQHNQTEQMLRQGTSLTRLLAEVPFEQLVTTGQQSALDVLFYSHDKNDLAYAVTVSEQGLPLKQVVKPGVFVSSFQLPQKPTHWMGQRTIEDANSGSSIMEFYAPLLDGPLLKGYIRLGYFQPKLIPGFDQWSFAATLALPIFLLATLFYFLVRRETRPILKAQEAITEQLNSGHLQKIEISAHGEVGDFINNFNTYVNYARNRIVQIETEQSTLLASSKVLEYNFSKVQAMLQALPDGIIVLDNSGAPVFANDKVAMLLGVDSEYVVTQPSKDWCVNETMQAFITDCQRRPGHPFGPETIVLEQSDAINAINAVSISAQPLLIKNNNQTVSGTVIVLKDASSEYLAQSSRENFVAHIAHELKTPLNAVAMYSELLLDLGTKDEKTITDAVNVIHCETERMIELINNTLSITKIEMGSMGVNRQRVNLSDMLEDAFSNIVMGSKDEGLEFDIKLPSDIPPVSIDKNLMRIAINNLLTNAVKYNRPGGKVTLELIESENSVFVYVRDTGIGISDPDQSKIFQQFFRSEDDLVRERSGHGLGLTLVKDIVELHQGKLSVSSTPGKGSEFIIEFQKETERLKQAV